MPRSIDPLIVGKVIGDVIDTFVPRVDMAIHYSTRQVMTDPDAPSPSEPSLREWLHWIVTDIPGNSGGSETNTGFSWLSEQATSTSSSGRELVPYIGPRPPIGIHRYIFVLFKQPSQSFLISPPAARNNFSTRNFAAYYGLGLPVAATYCNSQKEPASRSR
uniref:Mother of FT and TFL1-like protein n=1 Tax=Physcomitrium patens TaxID=3218 RepID=A0A7I4APD1_PHYPA